MGTLPGKAPTLSGREGTPLLLERETELELLERLLNEAAHGRGSFLLLEGPAGIGKTRLLEELRARATAMKTSVLHARGGELERGFPYGIVRQLYEPLLARSSAEEQAALLAGAAALAAPLLANDRPEQPLERADASFSLQHGLFWLTANLAERAPAAVLVDDLQWADSPSLRFLSYLTRRVEGLAILVAAAARPHEPGADDALLAELASDPATAVVRPAPLSLAAARELVRASGFADPAPEFERAVYAACGGNPLLLRELVRAAREQGLAADAEAALRVRELGSQSLTRFVVHRLRRLGPAAESLAQAVAVLGESELEVAAALAGLGQQEAAATAVALARLEILRSHGRLGFAHPVLRSAVYEDLADPARQLAHARAAELLAARGATPEQLAVHLLHAPRSGSVAVVATLREAARRAVAEGAPAAARAYLERALAELRDPRPPPGLLLELGRAELDCAAPGAIEHLREAHARLTDPALMAEAARTLASALYTEGRLRDAADVLRATIERLDPGETALEQQLHAELIAFARFDARLYPLAVEQLEKVRERVDEKSFGGRFLLALLSSELSRRGEAPDQARALAERALSGGLPLDGQSFQPYLTAVQTLVSLDELDAATRLYTAWAEDARRRGSAFACAHACSFRALAMLRRGDLAEAEADARSALDAARTLAPRGGYPFTLAFLAEILAERGELAEAMRTLELGPSPDEERPTFQMVVWLDARARLRIVSGEAPPEQGVKDLLEVGERLAALGIRNPAHAPWRSQAALLLLRLGERQRALQIASEEVALARRWGAPRPLGVALRAAGLVEGGEKGLELLAESVDVLAPSPVRLELARSLVELGAALRRANRRAEAKAALYDGRELAARCGAIPLAERAHEELLATGARPRRLARTGLDALTPSERRVARMASEGKTNREIAQALFVTPKTVEMHLSSVYRKLGIKARSQLPSALAP